MDSEAKKALMRAVGEGVGEATTCWESLAGTGEFNSTRATRIVDDIVKAAVKYAEMQDQSFQNVARLAVFEYIKTRLEKTDVHVTFDLGDVYVVWFCKTLQNWKALISTTLPDGMYYEVTYNGDKDEIYLDAYKKFDNVKIELGEETTNRQPKLIFNESAAKADLQQMLSQLPPGALPGTERRIREQIEELS